MIRFLRVMEPNPPRVSSSVQGSTPGDFSVRFLTWQELVAVATSTYMDPSASMTNGCMSYEEAAFVRLVVAIIPA